MLIGMLAGMFTTYLNSKKKLLNENGVIDTLGTVFVFLVPSLAGGIYSAMLIASTAYGPNNNHDYIQADGARSRWAHGGYQILGVAITVFIALICGALIGVLIKVFTKPMIR